MGLDATVYRRGHTPDDHDCSDHEAIHRRLGNIAFIGHIRERAATRLAPDAVLLQKVLYSGSHGGDELAVESVPTMRMEIELLANDPDPDMRTLVRSMSELAEAALEQPNPICF